MTELIPAVASIRMSTPDQKESPEVQIAEIKKTFSHKYNILKWYIDEGKSGSHDKERRTEYLKMLKDAKKGEWKVILCMNRSRFTREDMLEAAADKKYLRDLGIKLDTVDQGEVDWNTSQGRVVDAVMTESDNDYSVKISKNTLRGKLKKALQGKAYGQKTPYGLARQITDHKGETFVVARTDEFQRPTDWQSKFIAGEAAEVETVKWMFTEFATRDVSFHQLARELNEKRIPSPSGKTWVYQVIHEILKNVRYVGDTSLGIDSTGNFFRLENGEVVRTTKKGRQSNRSDAILIPGTHNGIVERELFDSVQAKLARRKRSKQHSQRDEGFALTGVVYCGQCGKPMYGNERTDSKKHRVGVKYHCKGWHRSFESGCGQWAIHQDDLLPFLVDQLAEQIDLKLSSAKNVKSIPTDDKGAGKKLAKLKDDYAKAKKRFLLADDSVAADLADTLKQMKSEIESMEKRVEQSLDTSPMDQARRWGLYAQLMKKLIVVRNQHSTPSQIREIFHQLGAKVTLWFEQGTRKGNGKPSRAYRVAKGRIQTATTDAEFSPHFERPASDIV